MAKRLQEIAVMERKTQIVFVADSDGKEMFFNPNGGSLDDAIAFAERHMGEFTVYRRHTQNTLMKVV